MALVQGLTEFLPISSSAHLILSSEVLGWPDQGLAFDTAVHLGTLAAVLFYFHRDLRAMLHAFVWRTEAAESERRLAWCIAIASLPALTVGFLAAAWISEHLRNPQVIAITTLVFALLLWQADVWGKRIRPLGSVRWPAALVIGLMQVAALIPGTSRAGVTMTAGLWLGLTREAAAKFSFLLAIPVLAGAGAYSVLKLLQDQTGTFELKIFIGAAVLSALVALLTVHLFVRLVEKVGMLPFVVYRLILAAVLFYLFIV